MFIIRLVYSLFVMFFFSQLNNITPTQGIGVELLATFQLVLCVLAITDKRRRDVMGSAPLAIGLSVCLGHLTAVSDLAPAPRPPAAAVL